MPEGSPRILITRLSHIGDCVLTLPVLCALRREYPSAYIAWAVEKPTNQLLELHPDLDDIILIPKGWIGKPGQWGDIRRRLRAGRFDIAVDPQCITKSAMLAWLSGAKQRIGLRGKWGRELSGWLNNQLVQTQSPHVVDRSLEMLGQLEISSPPVKFRLPVDATSQQQVLSFLEARQIQRPFVVLNPGASWPSKRWDNDSFAAVVRYLDSQHNVQSVVTWAGDEEYDMARAIVHCKNECGIVAAKTSLREYAALCDYASFFIGCDTGPMHIAAAMGTPCIGLYGTTLPTESGAYGPENIAVQKWHQDGTSRERRKAENQAMMAIKPEDVFEACDRMVRRVAASR
jgi:lipopolysaccharide heptosyltransferase I